jgi:hypothetical protein
MFVFEKFIAYCDSGFSHGVVVALKQGLFGAKEATIAGKDCSACRHLMNE